LFPPGIPSVCRIAEAGDPKLLFSTFGFFDDLDVLPNGWVVANGSDLSDLSDISYLCQGILHGSLIFASGDGDVLRVFKDEKLIHPSSVKVVDRDLEWLARGDVLITDKGVDGEYAAFILKPHNDSRSWITENLA
jgi:hypothetical protein